MNFFTGRLNRINFWGGLGFIFLVFPFILMIVNPVLEAIGVYSSIFEWTPLLILIFISLSISVRRLHDVDKSGFYLFLLLVPIANLFVPIWLVSTKGSVGENKYGEEDKGFSVYKLLMGVSSK